MNEQNMLHKTEYCAERYSNRTMVPIRTGKLEVYAVRGSMNSDLCGKIARICVKRVQRK